MSRPLLRALLIPKGQKTDRDGLAICDDWLLVELTSCTITGDENCNTCETVAITTDRVHASEYGAMVPCTQHGLARLFVDAVNALLDGCDREQWQSNLRRWDAPVRKLRRPRKPKQGPRPGELSLFAAVGEE